MPSIFSKTKIGRKSPLQELKKKRALLKISLADAAKELNISQRHLEAVEDCRLNDLPSGIYGRKIVKEYSAMLGLKDFPVEEMFANADCNRGKDMFSRKTISNSAIVIPQVFKNFAVLGAIIICFFYLLNRFENVVKPPILQVTYPAENLIIDERDLDVSGYSESEAEITINGDQVLCDSEGNFNQQVNLRDGLNTIVIKAKKKYGSETTVVKQVLVQEEM